MVYIGLDVHVKQSYFCVMDGEGKVLAHKAMVTTAENFKDLVKHFRGMGEVKVALESTGISWWIATVLSSVGADVHVANAYQLKLIAHSKRKTDRYDSKVLADLLRCDGLPPKVYVPPEEVLRLRNLMRLRKRFVRYQVQAIVQAKAFLRQRGEDVRAGDFHSGRSWLQVTEEKSRWGFYLKPLHQMYQCMGEEVKRLEDAAQGLVPDQDKTLGLLKTIPGIGLLGGRTIIAAIGDVHRFSKSDQLISYAGLNPSERSSGEREQKGSISKQGRSELRDLLVQGAWAVLQSRRPDTALLKRFFYRVMHKRCSQVAVTALARKLLVIVYQVMKTGKPFDSSLYMEKAA